MLSVLAVAVGALWVVGVTLVATQAGSDPVGAGYDAANRALTLPLLLLVGYAVLLRTSPPGASRKGPVVLVVGSVLLLAGNVLEFWMVLLSGLHTEKSAARLGEPEAFWGSFAGWMVFVLGMLVTVAAAAMLGRAIGGLRGWILVVLAIVGLSATGLWAVSPLLAGAAGLALAGWLIGLVQPRHPRAEIELDTRRRATARGSRGTRSEA
ncbi:hypothetical protein [Nocardioides bizhenqiangii]|uniref:DUF4386 family protein n=1 Tax=Nocardioides bizhenqiangii TaxID=3095076 RepID=A0ABZ0ZPZ8_9ACTN|nr:MULTISPECIES: hypothetical protein [unclassified Nocardioides]MDZ5621611.1 hypothetical protein [Nocardioides sp. HM23]WQQ25553.1 hypothetical protein SHK19_16480 [Nocardioides sp. HM61]